ncbi:MAG: hypothetical protein QOI10_758 [Solirubrobacterales bacterium]|jgi:uncharacterized protein YbaA (DUF1428 family)|nr:hypothetical protein [Solirubrobacterales bacterium]
MAEYVDGFVVPVKQGKVDEYRAIAEQAGALWREFGALEYKECIADDVDPGKSTSFPRSVKLEDDEVVAFSWITYESKAKRDEVNAKVMADPRLKEMMGEGDPPMDMGRMFFGGFEVIVDA